MKKGLMIFLGAKMLTEFHFDEDLLSSDDMTSLYSHALNASLLDFWYERGGFVYPFNKLTHYKEWIQYIHPKYIAKWQAALSGNITGDMSNGYRKIADYTNFESLLSSCSLNGIDLVLVPSTFDKLGINESTDIYTNGIDICKVNSFLDAPVIRRNKELLNKGILPGDDINQVWNSQFIKIAKHSKTITIIDRYFGDNLCKEMSLESTSIKKFIDLLAPLNKKFNITIYTVGGIKGSQKHIEIENYIRHFMSKSNVSKVVSTLSVCSCDDVIFRDNCHERYIAFESFIFKIDRGMQIFSPYPQVATSISIYRKTSTSTFSHALKALTTKRLWFF